MCAVSAVGDNWRGNLLDKWPQIVSSNWVEYVNRAEFDALKKEVTELKKLLRAAKEFDEATGQTGCEMDEKVDLIKKIAVMVGVDLEDIFSK